MTNKLSTMTDKEKRLRKILDKIDMRGKLKSVATLEKAHIVLVDVPEKSCEYIIYIKDDYQRELTNGIVFPEDRVHFMVPTNPRNRRQLEHNLMSNRNGLMISNPK